MVLFLPLCSAEHPRRAAGPRTGRSDIIDPGGLKETLDTKIEQWQA
jgi:hypothetical protein